MSLSQTKSNPSFIYFVTLICLIAVAVFMFSKSDFFLVKDIHAEGLHNVGEDEVTKLLGTVKGENIFLVDTDALAQKLKFHPLVHEAAVQKKYPGTLIIKIEERIPAALILDKGRMAEVDSQGVILKYYDTWPQTDCPVLTGVDVQENLGPGQKLSAPGLKMFTFYWTSAA
jgi:cell division protein FtsQ